MYFADYAPDAHGTPIPDAVVRPAVRADLAACAALLASREGREEEWTPRLERWLDEGQPIFVAELDGAIVGYARLSWQEPGACGGRAVPDGFYLSGIIVDPRYRRRGLGRALTQARCDWAWARGQKTYFVVNALNAASQDLHRELGFREITRDFAFPGITFTGGEGVLFGATSTSRSEQVVQLRMRAAS